MNTFKKGDVVESCGRKFTVAYKNGPYVHFEGGDFAHYSNCNLMTQPKFGVGDTVRSQYGEAVVREVLPGGRCKVEYDHSGLGVCINSDSFYTLVRRANPAPTLGDILSDAVKRTVPALETVFAELNAGRRINAIKEYRVIYGVGLKEAMNAVDAIDAAMKLAAPVAVAPGPIKAGDLVECIDNSGAPTSYTVGKTYLVNHVDNELVYCNGDSGRKSAQMNYRWKLATPKPPARDSIVVRFENGKYQPNSPPKVHPSLAEATAEAERLAKKKPGIAFAAFSLMSHSTATAPSVTTVAK